MLKRLAFAKIKDLLANLHKCFATYTQPWNMSWAEYFSKYFHLKIEIISKISSNYKCHSCMPGPLAPDPIMVKSCVYCLF